MKLQDLLLFCFLLYWLACCPPEGDPSSQPQLASVFNPEEIEEISHILAHFDREVCLSVYMDTFYGLDCHERFLDRFADSIRFGMPRVPLSMSEMAQQGSHEGKRAFDEIWVRGYALSAAGDSTEQYLLNPNGKYAQFLLEMGTAYPDLLPYAQAFRASGALSDVMVEYLAQNYRAFDLHDEQVRLVFAVHYLTLSDHLRTMARVSRDHPTMEPGAGF